MNPRTLGLAALLAVSALSACGGAGTGPQSDSAGTPPAARVVPIPMGGGTGTGNPPTGLDTSLYLGISPLNDVERGFTLQALTLDLASVAVFGYGNAAAPALFAPKSATPRGRPVCNRQIASGAPAERAPVPLVGPDARVLGLEFPSEKPCALVLNAPRAVNGEPEPLLRLAGRDRGGRPLELHLYLRGSLIVVPRGVGAFKRAVWMMGLRLNRLLEGIDVDRITPDPDGVVRLNDRVGGPHTARLRENFGEAARWYLDRSGKGALTDDEIDAAPEVGESRTGTTEDDDR